MKLKRKHFLIGLVLTAFTVTLVFFQNCGKNVTNADVESSYSTTVDTITTTRTMASRAWILSGMRSYTFGQSFIYQWESGTDYVSLGQRNKVYSSATNTLIANNPGIADWNATSGTGIISTTDFEPFFQSTDAIRIEFEIMQKNNSGVWSSVGTTLSITVTKNAVTQLSRAWVPSGVYSYLFGQPFTFQ